MKNKNKLTASSGRMTRLVSGLFCWIQANGRSVRALCWTLPQYAWGKLHPSRNETEPSLPRLLLGRKQWISAKRWEQPRLDVCVMAGMGEHYGSNHFGARLPVGAKLVWIKRLDDAFGSFLSDAEEAWMKGGHGIYCKRDLSMNGETLTRQHPCQKPVPLMAWCMDKAKVPEGATVVDPYMGSGSTIIAAIRTGRKAIGFEIDPEHFEATTARIKNELAQGDLFLGHNAERTHGADNA